MAFNASHFLSFPIAPGVWRAERLHSHDFRFSLVVESLLDETECVVDFDAAMKAAKEVLKRWQYRILVPIRNPNIATREVSEKEFVLVVKETVAVEGANAPTEETVERSITGPKSDFLFLNATNSSTEIIAARLLDEWLRELKDSFGISRESLTSVCVRLEETPGCSAIVSRP